ncbi:MAG: O-antigen ligase family protein [Pseudomonadota bacterium]
MFLLDNISSVKSHLTNDRNRYFLALFTGFFIPISTALTNIFCPLVLIFLLIEGDYKQKLKDWSVHPIAWSALLLFAVMILGLLYSSAAFSDAGRILSKYREFFYIPLFLLIFRDSKARLWGLYGFLGAMGLTLFISYFTAITGWEIVAGTILNSAVFKNYITQNLLMALAAYFLVVQLWTQSNWKWMRGFVVLLAIYNILFMSLGRTGYLVLFCLIILLFYQIYHLRGILVAGLLLTIASGFLYSNSSVLQQRIDVISDDIQRYNQGEIVDHTNSIGSRIEFYQNSLILIAKNPIFGTGTGSFSHEYKQLADKKGIRPTTNPHNEYLMITVQWGLIGLSLFLYLLYCLWKTSSRLEKPQQLMAQGLFVTIVVGCLFNSFWLDSTEGHLFAYLIGVFYGKYRS